MSASDIEYIEKLEKEVDELRQAALNKARLTDPDIQYAVDRRSVDDYCLMTWDYPGKWYYAGFKLPDGFRTKDELIDAIARDTVRYFSENKNKKNKKRK